MDKITTPKKQGGDLQRIRDAHAVYMTACQALCDITKEELPNGTIVEVTLGRSVIRGEVTSHAEGWTAYGSGVIQVRNEKTGKMRTVNPSYDGHALKVITIP